MSLYDLVITIIISFAVGIISSGVVSEYYRRLYIINQIVNYAKETEVHFNEIKFEANKFAETGNVGRLEYLLNVAEVYRKDIFKIRDQELQQSIANCNRSIYELHTILTSSMPDDEKVRRVKVFDFANPFLKLNNALIHYKYSSNKRIINLRNYSCIIAVLIVVVAIVYSLR